MSSREFPKLSTYFDATEHPKKSSIRQIKNAQHHKTVSSESLIEKSSITKPRVTSSDGYGDGYVSSVDGEHRKGDPWLSGFWRRMPTLAVLALLMVPLCAGSDAVILYKSDGQEVDAWKISPSVLLAILSAVANMCLQFARSEGVIISWWRKALRGGTLYDLSRYWESGDSILGAATPGRGFNLVALATILAQAVYLDGPLLQKASTVIAISVTRPANVTALIAEELPYGFTGLWPAMVMNQTFLQVVTDYTVRNPITVNFTGCEGKCVGSMKAAGLAVNCSDEVHTLWNNSWTDYTSTVDAFSSNFNFEPSNDGLENPMITFNLSYATARQTLGVPGQCYGTLVSKQCSMYSATLLYPVALSNGTIVLDTSSPTSVDHIQPVGSITNLFDYHAKIGNSFSTLAGVTVAAQNLFGAQAVQTGVSLDLNGLLACQYVDYGTGNSSFFATQDPCTFNWKDPTADIINALNEIMFRTALVASNVSRYAFYDLDDQYKTEYWEAGQINVTSGDTGMSQPQILEMQQTSTITVFKSNYSYLAAALAVMMVGFSVVIPTLCGFWEMGRRTSLNPLEIAKAFNAALLQEQRSNVPAHQLTKVVGDRLVKYGEIIEDYQDLGGNGLGLRPRASKLGIADSARVRKPEFRAMYN
ncbi:hypothetical protein N431DRAFT_444024 [Stipitochalara longipes BDJ]|nr:hypothetical protein N431DRAFT_444024 [Stipitochalara longipes BDJ]